MQTPQTYGGIYFDSDADLKMRNEIRKERLANQKMLDTKKKGEVRSHLS
jgi:hypothetical protein